MAFNFNHVSTKKIFIGETGSGKSTGAMSWIRDSRYRHYFIFDHDGQFGARNKLKSAFNPDQILKQLREQRFVVFNPSEMFDDPTGDCDLSKRAGGFDWFCGYVYKLSEMLKGPNVLYLDEIQDIVSVNKMPSRASKVFTSGRNRELDFVGASLQYNLVNNRMRAGMSHTYAFRTTEENALAALASRNFDPEEIKRLPDFHYVMRDVRGNVVRGSVSRL